MSRKGVPNKIQHRDTIKALIDDVSREIAEGDEDGLRQTLKAAFKAAKGDILRVTAEGVIYREPPDARMTKILLEHRFGKPQMQVEVLDESERFNGLPQLILVAPKGYKGPQAK